LFIAKDGNSFTARGLFYKNILEQFVSIIFMLLNKTSAMKQLMLAIAFLFLFINAFPQNPETTLAKYAKDFVPEKMYLHYDKSSYAPGETVWFKAYLMKTFLPDQDCKTVYVDWINNKGKVLSHTVCAAESGTTFGQFEIPPDYNGGFIHVKAYTKWMLNFDSSFLYNKDLRIISDKTNAMVSNEIIPEINFFPEGGDAVIGVLNKVVFKANDQYGRPIIIKGVIKNNKGSVIDSLNIIHDGMGFFFIMPQENETFSADWQFEKGETHHTPLAAIKNSGIALHVTIAGGRRNFSVAASPLSLSSIKKIHILGTMYQQKIFDLEEELNNGTVEGTIPTESLPSGILTLTVFDENYRPLAERITYINNEEYLSNPEISVETKGTGKRQKNEISISVPDGFSSDFSVSVTDAKIDHDNRDNIISHLLLTGEIKGRVYDPAHYFLNNSDSITRQMDLVMLTHGWRRFNWEKVVKGELPEIKYQKDTSYLSLSGIISGGATQAQLKKAEDIILMLTEKKSGTQTFTIPIGPDGYFNDPSLILFDTAHVFYSLSNSKKLKDISVRFMPGMLPPVSSYLIENNFYNGTSIDTSDHYHIELNDAAQQELQFFKGKVLATVKIKSRIKSNKELLNEKYTSGVFKNQNATELDLLSDPFSTSYTDLISYIEGKVPGLTYDHVASKFLWMRNRSGENGPTLYLNEMATTYDMLSSIPVANVAFIKVFRPGFVGGAGSGTGGAIVIYTRMGADGQPVSSTRGLDNSLVTGYSAIREFYSPDYDSIYEGNNKKDLRTTLYWNPSLIATPDQSKVTFSFYNNDISNSFRMIIEGMNKEGQLTHIEKELK